MSVTGKGRIITGDCRELAHGPYDLIIADPPYGDTSLKWDRHVDGWFSCAEKALKPNGSIWAFGSMRFFLTAGRYFELAGLRYAQDVVWEKHNGSAFHADRFKRVHEHVVQFYRADCQWASVYNDVQTTLDASARTVRRKQLPPHHLGARGPSHYVSKDGGPRVMRSVIYMRSCHGRAIHPTEKPDALLEILIRTSCPPNGMVADLFAGSGACGEAAMRAGREYIGFEIDPVMADRARERIAGKLPLVAA